MRKAIRFLPLLALAAMALAPGAAGGEAGLSKTETSMLGKIADEWATLCKWCVSKKLGEEARKCAALAADADPSAKGLAELKTQADECEDAGAEADKKAWGAKFDAAKKKVSGNFEKLYSAGARETDPAAQARFEGYLFKALELDQSDKMWNSVAGLALKAVAGKEEAAGLRIASRALGLNPPEKAAVKLRAAVEAAAVNKLVVMSASSHPLKYYFSLPKGYKRAKGRKWPVILCVDGAGSNFEGMGRSYMNQRGDVPLIVVSPCSFSNTNEIAGAMVEKYRKYYSQQEIDEGNKGRLDWDEQGVLTILKDLAENFDAEDKVYVTGFSGGGNIAYMMIFKHPDLVAGAAPTCANFMNRQYDQLKGKFDAGAIDFPLHILTGANDPHRDYTHGNKAVPGIEPQTDSAMQVVEALGYPNAKRTMLPGVGHSGVPEKVMAILGPYMEGKKKRSDKLE